MTATNPDFEKSSAAALEAMVEIKNLNRNPGDAGSICCPLCGGVLRYRMAGMRQRVRAKCDADNCLEILE